jgi:hypothetical protein
MNKPVDRYLQILRIIERENETGIGVNQIIRKTGSKDKQRIINYIRDLGRAKIIETKSSPAHSQKEIKNLTDLGWELARLSHNLELYVDSCSEVRRTLKEEIYVAPEAKKEVRDRILRDMGWSSEELNSFLRLQLEAEVKGKIASPTEVINIILTKYITMLYKFKLKENNIGKLILDKIVMNAIYTQFSIEADIVSHRKQLNKGRIIDPSIDIISDTVYNCLRKLSMNNPFDNRFISSKVKQVLKSTLLLLDVPNEVIDKQIKHLQSSAKFFNFMPSFTRGSKEVVTICEEYMSKST